MKSVVAEVWNLKEVNERQAGLLMLEKRRVMCWLRRNTNLDDDAIVDYALKPIADVAFEAGHEIGFTEAMLKVDRIVKRAIVAKWVAVIISAACIAWWWSS